MLLKKVDLLESQTRHYEELVNNCEKNDSINNSVLTLTNQYWENHTEGLKSQLKKTNKQRNLYRAGMWASIVAALLLLIK